MSRKTRFKNLYENPLAFGLGFGILVIAFSLGIGAIFDGSLQGSFDSYVSNDPLYFLVPPAVAVQMGLFRHYRNLASNRPLIVPEKLGVSGAAFSSVTLVTCCIACCVEPVWGLLPAAGIVLAASSFVMEYQYLIIVAALLANLAGSALLMLLILRQKKNR